MEWIDQFQKVFETSVQPEALAKLKVEYVRWVKSRGSYYASLKDTCPEFLELLNAIEQVVGVEVKIEPKKKEK